MFKIAFIGTHGTGKTTYAHKLVVFLKEKGFNVDFSEEIARRCPLKINQEAKTDTQKGILSRQITEEIEKSLNCDVLVCDRSIIDTYSYQKSLAGEKPSWEDFIKDHLKTYDLLVKVPVTKQEIEKDNKRSTDKKFQEDVEKEIERNLEIFKPDYINYEGEKTIREIYEIYKQKTQL